MIDSSQNFLAVAALRIHVVLCTLWISGCGIVTKGSSLDVVLSDGTIQNLNMAPRHYRVKEHCLDVVTKVTPNLIASIAPLSVEQKATLPWPKRILSYKAAECQSFKRRILDELKATLKRNGVNDSSVLVIKRVEKREEIALRAVAEFIHIDRVSLLIGINSIHANAMVKLADPAQVPIFIVNPNSKHSKSGQSMRVYPPVNRLAQKLYDQYARHGVTHTTVLYPRNADLDLLEQLKRIAGTSFYFMESSYDSNASSDVLASIKGAAARMALVRSKSQGLLILDNFKMVRHIVNIVRSSIGDMNIIMTGNQQWRSPALVTPREEALEGAMFVDFIGSYADLPPGLEVPLPESPYFTTAQAASRIDYQIIGHRLGTIAAQVIRKPWSRQRIATELQQMKNSWDNYFPIGEPVFDSKRDSSWPAFLFKIQGDKIQIDNAG
ncbi:MAG: hypothetical protein NTV34_20545 [Proteobacteria bacterium]|nr:hypothetical protein [Pseudomonadota bacterium]